jgi:hypothetical protein
MPYLLSSCSISEHNPISMSIRLLLGIINFCYYMETDTQKNEPRHGEPPHPDLEHGPLEERSCQGTQ